MPNFLASFTDYYKVYWFIIFPDFLPHLSPRNNIWCPLFSDSKSHNDFNSTKQLFEHYFCVFPPIGLLWFAFAFAAGNIELEWFQYQIHRQTHMYIWFSLILANNKIQSKFSVAKNNTGESGKSNQIKSIRMPCKRFEKCVQMQLDCCCIFLYFLLLQFDGRTFSREPVCHAPRHI